MALNRMSGGFQVSYDNAGEYIAGNSQVRVVDIDVDEYDEERVREAVEAAMSLAGLSTSPQKQHKKHRQYVAPRLSKQRGRGRLRFTEVRALYVSFDRFGGGDADPFRALPEFAGGNGHLIHHWNKIVAPPDVMGPRKEWFPFAVQDPTLFQATLFVAAANYDTLNGRKLEALFLHHRGALIRTISSRIENPETATTDSTIGAVTLLMMVDSMRSPKEVALTHLRGLQQLIMARGGFDQLDSRIRVMIVLNDMLASSVLNEPPHFIETRFDNADPNVLYGPPSLSTQSYARDLSARLSSFTGNVEASDAVANLYWGLRNLSILLDKTPKSESNKGLSFSTRAEFLEHQTRKLLASSVNEDGTPKPDANLTANTTTTAKPDPKTTSTFNPIILIPLFCHATLIYTYSILQQLAPCVPVYAQLSERLETVMDIPDSQLNILLGTFPDLMLWVLFLGGKASPATMLGASSRKVWFAKTAARILRVRKVEEREGIEVASQAFLWPDGKDNYIEEV